MRDTAVQREIFETYKDGFVQERGFGIIGKRESECVVFCKKVTPGVFAIRDGFAVLAGDEDFYEDGACMISNFTKVVFVFDQEQESENLGSG